MFCQKCGKGIEDSAVVCPNCGCPVNGAAPASVGNTNPAVQPQPYATEEGEKPGLSTCAIAFAILMPIVGLILGIIGTVKYKETKLKNRCIIAIPLSIVVWAVFAFIYSM